MSTNFWTARQKDSAQYNSFTTKINHGGEGIDFIFGLKENDESEIQAIHLLKDSFPTKQKAAAWLKKRNYKAVVESSSSSPIEEVQMPADENTTEVENKALDETVDNIIEAGKRHSSSDASSMNQVLRLMMSLMKKEDLEQQTIDHMSSMCMTDYKKPVNESKEEKSTEESTMKKEEDLLVEWNKLDGETFEETLTCSMGEASYDEDSGIVSNVDILGSVSKNKRRYSENVQKEASPLFEGAKAYLNHQSSKDMKEARRVEDMIGDYHNVHVENGKTKGDLHLIKEKKSVVEHVIPLIKSAPHLVGNSIVARGTMKKAQDGIYEVEKILGVRSVDIVSEPATTSGLFSESVTEEEKMTVELKDMTLAQLKEARPELFEAYEADSKEKERVMKLEKDLKEAQEQLVEKDKKIIEMESRETKREKNQKITSVVHEAKVPDSFRYDKDSKNIKSHLVSILERCANDEEMKAIVKDWEETFEGIVTESTKKVPVKAVSTEKKAIEDEGELQESDLLKLHNALVS